MPDWSYQTLFRPLLFRLPAAASRAVTLHAIGLLSRLPLGSLVIRTLGHMETAPLLESKLAGIPLKYPVGLSGGLDPLGTAHRALAQFGFGFVEIGPVTVQPVAGEAPMKRELSSEAIIYPDRFENQGLAHTLRRLERKQGHRLPIMLRLAPMPGSTARDAVNQMKLLAEQLSPYAAALYIDGLHPGWSSKEASLYLEAVAQALHSACPAVPLLLYVPLDYPPDRLESLASEGQLTGWAGIALGDTQQTAEGDVAGRNGKQLSIRLLSCLRRRIGPELPIIAAGGVHEPQDALELKQAGASYVQLHSGMVYAGPGLAKRVNEALIYEQIASGAAKLPSAPPFWHSWGWMCLLGIGMIIGGLLAWIIAATTVVLPYDLAYLLMTPEQIAGANGRLLPFMSHDRVTLAGTMISIGILYYQLGRYGLREGLHWARTALLTSGLVGFSSFFLYLGYGYFDPLHALAGALLLPMFIMSMRSGADLPLKDQPNLRNDRSWRLAQWGQLLFVILGFALAIGGIVISVVGITGIFVATDLEFLCTTPDMLAQINERLLPLIAHDRAGFGGALFSNALALLATALWGLQQGQRWLWWTLLVGGFPGFLAGFSVHAAIGYTDFWHLAPAYFAFALYAAGLVLLYPYLMKPAGPIRRLDTSNPYLN
ncbi:hypothetical protein [Paenibacillus sp. y28]|uniref:hypothetical protein n=1 Tax=Paenibacillus sp. y28 TaxID=3129110 RepID=UPI003017AFBD